MNVGGQLHATAALPPILNRQTAGCAQISSGCDEHENPPSPGIKALSLASALFINKGTIKLAM